jgi:hypothetical protein
MQPAAGGASGAATEAAAKRPTINVYLVNAEADRARCLMEVNDLVCETTTTWMLCGGEQTVIAICADEKGLGHTRVRIANAEDDDYAWVEYTGVTERDLLKR